MNVKIRRADLNPLFEEMKKLNGLPLKKALTFGEDRRTITAETDKLSDFETTKTTRLIELEDELKAKLEGLTEVEQRKEVINAWPNVFEYNQLVDAFRVSERDFMQEEIELTFKTTFVEKDIDTKKISSDMGWMLSYFMK